MKTYLTVPFEERHQAQSLGAKWHQARKSWYVEDHPNIAQFMRWMPGVKTQEAKKWAKVVASMDGRQAKRGRFR